MEIDAIKTLDDVKNEVARIEAMKDDDELAHSSEDDLHQAVLHQIALGHPQSAEMAKEALRTRNIYFARWCD